MIVYVESNFILELAFGQEEAAFAESILARAEDGQVELVLPAIALYEPLTLTTYRDRERRKTVNTLSALLAQLRRSTPYQDEATQIGNAIAGLRTIAGREAANLQHVLRRVLVAGRVINLSASLHAQAEVYETQYGLSPQDSIVYSCVIADLQQIASEAPKCFMNRNRKDFATPISKRSF